MNDDAFQANQQDPTTNKPINTRLAYQVQQNPHSIFAEPSLQQQHQTTKPQH